MKRILYLLFLLSLPFVAFAQYPNAPNKIVLGRQTTGDGLIFRTNGQPSWTPANAANAWMALDTLTGNIWIYRSNEWFLQVAGDLKLDYPLVINKSTVNILQGQVVMVDTVQLVQGDRVRVRPAIATMSNSQYIMGVASEDIPNDSTGYITWFGYVREVDHADIAQTGVTLDVGDILYISATEAGRYTDTEPAAPNVNATIALVVRKPNANNMTLLVRPWLNEKLGDLSDVDLSGIANGQSIAWDSINRKFIPATFGTGSGTGTVTSITAGAGLTGGTITTSGTIAADTANVLASKTWVQTRGYLTSEVDGSITNEGVLGVGAGGANTAVITSNTSAANGVTIAGGVGVGISETTSTNGGTISFAVDTAVIATVSAVRDTATVLRSLISGSNLQGNGLAGTVTFWSAIDTLTFDSSFTYNASTNILGLPSLGKYQIGGTTVAYLADNGSLFLGDGGASAASAFYNFGAGIQSLQSLTSGDRNTAAGYQSMRLATTAIDNTAFGYQALHDATTANYNAAFGYRPLFNNIAGLGNVAMGYESLFTVDSTNYNVGIGNYSLYYAKSTGNTAVGHSSSGFNVSGDYNTALGYQALYRNVGGDNNVAVGRDAGFFWQTGVSSNFNQEPQNSVYIGYNTRAGAAGQTNEIVIGTNAIGNGSHTATIGSDSINATFLKGQLKLPMYATNDFSGTAVKYLAVDSDGDVIEVDPITGGGGVGGSGLTNKVAYWSNDTTLTYDTNFHFDPTNDRLGIGTATPGFPLTVNGRIGIASTQMLYLPGGNFTGTMFVGDGGGSLSYSSGDQGRFNTFVGIGSGSAITTGRANTGLGYNSLNAITSQEENTAFGWRALRSNTSSQNSAFGAYSLDANQGGQNNSAFGRLSLANITTGSNNVAFGHSAGQLRTGGTITNVSNSIFIGAETKASADSQTNQIVIGYNATGNGSNTTTIGNASTTATYLRGQLRLEEYGDTNYVGTAVKYLGVTDSGDVIEVDAPTGGGGGGVGGSGLANKVAYWTNDSTLTYNTQFHFNPSLERLGIGTSAPAEKIEALGNIRSTLGRVLVNTTGSQVIHVSNYYAGDSGGQNIWIGNGGNNDLGNDESIGNTAVGVDAMLNYGSGSSNAAFGYGALKGSTTWGGFRTTAIGSSSQELTGSTQDNTSLGYHSLRGTSGNANTALGSYALAGQNTGDYNIGLGFRAGVATIGTDTTLNTSRNSIFIGGFTKANDESSVNEVVIGHQATGDGSNTTVIGNDSITSTKLKGQLKLPMYATNDYSGTVSKYLAVDASGNVIEVDSVAAGGNTNIYNTSDTLTSNRVVSTNTYDLQIIGTHNELAKLAMVNIVNNDTGQGANKDSRALSTFGYKSNLFAINQPPVSTNDTTNYSVLSLNRYVPVTGGQTIGNRSGGYIDMRLNTTTVPFIETLRLGSRWSNADNATRNSEFYLTLRKNSTTLIEPLVIKNTGQLQLAEYATNNFSGTPAKLLAVDASGNVIEVDTLSGGSSGIGGTVAANKVAFGAPSGDTLTSNTNFHWDNTNGRLGVGTSSPSGKLQINNQDGFIFDVGASAKSFMRFGSAGTDESFGELSFTRTSGDIAISQGTTGGGLFNRIIINGNGNVGIGTTAPGTPLDVKASPVNGIAYRLRARGADGAGLIQFTDSLISTQYATIGTTSPNTLQFTTASTERMRITSTGNVAIGNIIGAERLHVTGNVRMTGNLQRAAPVTVAASTHTLAESTSWLIINNAGTCTVTLPAASLWTGREVTIKTITANAVVSASSNVVPIDGDAAGSAILPATDGAWAKLVSDGTNWIIMQKG